MGVKEAVISLGIGGSLGFLCERLAEMPELAKTVSELIKNNPEATEAILTAITTADTQTLIASLVTAGVFGVGYLITKSRDIKGKPRNKQNVTMASKEEGGDGARWQG